MLSIKDGWVKEDCVHDFQALSCGVTAISRMFWVMSGGSEHQMVEL